VEGEGEKGLKGDENRWKKGSGQRINQGGCYDITQLINSHHDSDTRSLFTFPFACLSEGWPVRVCFTLLLQVKVMDDKITPFLRSEWETSHVHG